MDCGRREVGGITGVCDLHHRVSRDPVLESQVLSVFVEELTSHLREATDTDDFAQPGMVTFIQRFGSTLNLHHHFHLLALDGVYESHGDDQPPVVTRAPPPTLAQIHGLLERVATRIRALIGSGEQEPEPEVQAPLLKVFGTEPSEPAEPKLVAQFDVFNLHAVTHFEAHERVALERFCRYALRGPLAQGRLTPRPGGKLVYRLKTPKPDGTTHVVFTPQALLQPLRWILPLPRRHLRRVPPRLRARAPVALACGTVARPGGAALGVRAQESMDSLGRPAQASAPSRCWPAVGSRCKAFPLLVLASYQPRRG